MGFLVGFFVWFCLVFDFLGAIFDGWSVFFLTQTPIFLGNIALHLLLVSVVYFSHTEY